MKRKRGRPRKEERDELTKAEKTMMQLENASQEAKRKAYLIHLWEVNSQWYPTSKCLHIIAPRAGYTYNGARDALIKMGYIEKKNIKRQEENNEEDDL